MDKKNLLLIFLTELRNVLYAFYANLNHENSKKMLRRNVNGKRQNLRQARVKWLLDVRGKK